MARTDPHSFFDSSHARADTLSWLARVDFATRTLECEATLRFRDPAEAGPLDLDTRDLRIASVADDRGRPLPFELGAADPILGSRLRLQVPAGSTSVRIRYATSPNASALQWLDPTQTQAGRQPFLHTQCQPIHARSIVPLQDTP